jgi:hypothetical protein
MGDARSGTFSAVWFGGYGLQPNLFRRSVAGAVLTAYQRAFRRA